MRFLSDLSGGNPMVQKMGVYDGTSLSSGALLIKGTTLGTDGGQGIVATGALTDCIGVLQEDVSSFGTVAAGTILDDANLADVIINPLGLYEVEYDQTDDIDVASTSTTTVTITSLEDNIDGGWLFNNNDDAAGFLLAHIGASASGSCTTLTATGWTSGTDVIKILPRNHGLAKITTNGTSFGSDAAAGSGLVYILDNFIKSDTVNYQRLQPAVHDNTTGGSNARIFAHATFRDFVTNTDG